jgi:pimeloyl-ACP methyl ester carboxylesterase
MRQRSGKFRLGRPVLLTASGPLALVLLAPGTSPAQGVAPVVESRATVAAVPSIGWGPCVPDLVGFECAKVRVPLDYDSPDGGRITLALTRIPATDQAHRIGSLFVNPGGPGGSGVTFVQRAGKNLSAAVGGRFDIVGFDPRGIGASTPLSCFRTREQLLKTRSTWSFPSTPAEEVTNRRLERLFADACIKRGGPIIDHMSTADVARDLDGLRAAVGDQRLTYLGYSYGTQLGSVYANLFPDRIRAVVLDGVLDPIAWGTGAPRDKGLPFSTRLRSDQGADATFGQFLTLCDKAATDTEPQTNCSLGPNAKTRFEALAERLKTDPIVLPNGATLNYSLLVAGTLGGLTAAGSWPQVADFLASIEQRSPTRVLAAREVLASALGVQPAPTAGTPIPKQTIEGFPAVACIDSQNPPLYSAWVKAGAAADAAYPYFGRFWTWASSPCHAWPGHSDDRYLGPWDSQTANPVLVVGNYYDPSTRYQGAQAVAGLLPGSRLLSYAGWGHTAYLGARSSCVDTAVSAYLVAGTLPAQGTVCQPEINPFETILPGARRTTSAPATGLLPAMRQALGG